MRYFRAVQRELFERAAHEELSLIARLHHGDRRRVDVDELEQFDPHQRQGMTIWLRRQGILDERVKIGQREILGLWELLPRFISTECTFAATEPSVIMWHTCML